MNVLDPEIWGPHFWFFISTLALNYPNNPNDVTIKKYYEFIQNLPLFIPVDEIGNDFDKLEYAYRIEAAISHEDLPDSAIEQLKSMFKCIRLQGTKDVYAVQGNEKHLIINGPTFETGVRLSLWKGWEGIIDVGRTDFDSYVEKEIIAFFSNE